MIYFIYGQNDLSEQRKVAEIVKKVNPQEKIEINLAELTLAEFASKVTTPSIFGFKNLFLVEVGSTTDKTLIKILENIGGLPKDTHLVFKTSKKYRANSKILKNIATTKDAELIKLGERKDFMVFNFLDTVYTKNKKKAYQSLKKLEEKGEPAFKIHSMLLYQLRNIAKIKFGANFSASPFVKNKARLQAKEFTGKQIVELYEHFYKTDRDLKLGLISENIINVLTIEKITKKRD